MRNFWLFLATHRAIEVSLLVLVVVVAASGWFNSSLPKGTDALGYIPIASSARESVLKYHAVPEWDNGQYMGGPAFYAWSPLISVPLSLLSLIFGWVLAAKLLYLLFFALSGVFAYLYLLEVTRNRLASFVGGLTYTFLPFHLFEAVFEGHHDAGLEYAALPLLFLVVEKAIKKPQAGIIAIGGVVLAVLILAHPQAVFLLGPFFILYLAWRIWLVARQQKSVKPAIISCVWIGGLGLLLSAFWWFPFLWEKADLYSTEYSLKEAAFYSPTFAQAVTLRPGLYSVAPSTHIGMSGPIIAQLLQLFPVVLALGGVVLNYKNKYVWFFSASGVIALLLALGPHSPIDLFGFAHEHVPFFSGIRTSNRFLIFFSFAYAVLAGFCVKAIVDWLKDSAQKRLRPSTYGIWMVAPLLSLLVLANTWQDSRAAFQTWDLTSDQRAAIEVLSKLEPGRLLVIPMDTWVYSPETRNKINPMCYSWLTKKDTVNGGTPSLAPKWTGDFLERVLVLCRDGPVRLGGMADLMGVKYAVVDKTDPVSANYVLDDTFTKIWQSQTIDIYEHQDPWPSISLVSITNERPVDLWTSSQINVSWADGKKDAILSLDTEHRLSHEFCLKSVYRFTDHGGEWLNLGINVQGINFGQDDAIHLKFYSEDDLPDIYITLDVFEQDGSRYGIDLGGGDRIKAGWNEVSLPLSLLGLRYSSDENDHLDYNEIATLWFGAGEQKNVNKVHEFALYFDDLSIVSYKTSGSVEYTEIRPGKYKVHVNCDGPSQLVLTDSYHPNWVARMDGQTIPSSRAFEFANSWKIDQAGEHDLVLEFTVSGQRKAGRIISLLTAIGLVAFFVGREIKVRRRKRPRGVAGV